jgi:ATP-dependent Clp protease ATP-binding subunit ClpA
MSTVATIKFYDLISAAGAGKLTDVVEREAELSRLTRTLLRPRHHHAIVHGEPGSGKTSLVEALAWRIWQGRQPGLPQRFYRLRTEAIMRLIVNGDSLADCLAALSQAAEQLAGSIVVIEDVQLLTAGDPGRLELTLQILETLLGPAGTRLILTVSSSTYYANLQDDYTLTRLFEPIELRPADTHAVTAMVEQTVPRLERHHHQRISDEAVAQAVAFGGRFGHGRALPDAAIRLLEEAGVQAALAGQDALGAADITAVVAEREHMPVGELTADRQDDLAQLEPQLQQAVIGQAAPLRLIAATIARAQLGLADDSRPRGSFLLLGPSGVGKTETAKALTRLVYHNPNALVRLDMSEYAEAHAAVRLIGSPPGYVGYEEGGQLTGAVAREPYSLVLLDEIEKAHSKLFDVFLQLLDDGRLTDSSGKTVDFTQTLVLATSNCGATEIAAAATAGHDVTTPEFLQTTLMPLLLRGFRPEFLNRFDAILAYQPLSEDHLVALAERELQKLETRLTRHGVRFAVPRELLRQLLRPTLNPLFGARPVKRLITQYFETPIANQLLRRQLPAATIINGAEPWLSL